MIIVRIVGGLGNQMFQYAYAKALQQKGYSVKIDISKFKKYNPNKEPQPAKKDGWFNMYYRIYCTTSKYHFESDKRIVKKRFALSENRKRDIQSATRSISYLEGKIGETGIAGMQAVFYGMIESQTKNLMLVQILHKLQSLVLAFQLSLFLHRFKSCHFIKIILFYS